MPERCLVSAGKADCLVQAQSFLMIDNSTHHAKCCGIPVLLGTAEPRAHRAILKHEHMKQNRPCTARRSVLILCNGQPVTTWIPRLPQQNLEPFGASDPKQMKILPAGLWSIRLLCRFIYQLEERSCSNSSPVTVCQLILSISLSKRSEAAANCFAAFQNHLENFLFFNSKAHSLHS